MQTSYCIEIVNSWYPNKVNFSGKAITVYHESTKILSIKIIYAWQEDIV